MDALHILLGALIAMLTSVITTILVIKYQKIESERKRAWEIEDRKYQESKQILQERFQQLETYAKDIIRAAKSLQSGLIHIENIDDIQRKKDGIKEYVYDLDPIIKNVYLLGLIKVYGDDELHKLFSDAISIVQNYTNTIDRILSISDNNHLIDNSTLPDSMTIDLGIIYSRILKKIDNLRVSSEMSDYFGSRKISSK